MPHTLDKERLGEILEQLDDNPDLKKEDRHWVRSFADQYYRLGKLSDRQCEVLEEIWVKY